MAMASNSHRYDRVEDELVTEKSTGDEVSMSGDEEYVHTTLPSRSRRRTIFLITLAIIIITSLLIALFLEHRRGSNAHQEHSLRAPEECGQSPQEARELGCVFDIIIMGWVPPRCYDGQLANDFLGRTGWGFYRTANLTGPQIPTSDIMAGEWDEVFVNYEYHIIHCTYTWKKTQRVAASGEILDGYIADAHHTNHCEMMLLHEPLAENSAYIKYASCPWVHGIDQGRFGWYRIMGGKKTYRQQ